jgi:hypothetical protein
MPSPFPGMDPFLERPEIWPDFHDRLITYISEALQPLLRPRYVALTQDRLFVVESERPIRPDISVLQLKPPNGEYSETQALRTGTATAVVEFYREEMSQPYIEIIEPASGNRVVTSIEVLSPDNKAHGAGMTSYLRKQKELWDSGANLVEIDLLSSGARSSRVERSRVAHVIERRYLVTVTRAYPTRCEFYGFDLPETLPQVSIPLTPCDDDVPLDLQAAFERTYQSGPYPQLLYYNQPAPSKLSDAELSLVREVLRRQEPS